MKKMPIAGSNKPSSRRSKLQRISAVVKKNSKFKFSTSSTLRTPCDRIRNMADVVGVSEEVEKEEEHPVMIIPAAVEDDVAVSAWDKVAASRALMLKTRFADTILKAKQQLLGMSDGGGGGAQQKRMEEEKRRKEEIRIAELKRRRQRERVARENMKKTVEFNDQDRDVMEQLATWGCGRRWDGVSPLKKLGLFIKPDDFEYIERDPNRVDAVLPMDDDYEEGEIVS